MLASGQTQCASSQHLWSGNTLSHEEARLKSLQRSDFSGCWELGDPIHQSRSVLLISTSVWVGAKETDEPGRGLDWPLWKEGCHAYY